MLYQNVKVFGANLWIIDATCLGVTSFVWFGLLSDIFGYTPTAFTDQILLVTVLLLCFLVLSKRMKLYHVRRTEDLFSELGKLGEVTLYSVALATLLCIAFVPGFTGWEILLFALTNIVGILVFRLFTRIWIRYLRARGKDYRIWLIVGSGQQTATLVETINANSHFGIRIHDVVDLKDMSDTHDSSRAGSTVASVQDIHRILDENVIDEVVVNLPIRSCYDEIRELIKICAEAGIKIKLPTDFFDFQQSESELVMIGDVPLVTHFAEHPGYYQLVLKRLLDVAGALIGLTILTPLFALVALAIKLDSRGPVIYWASRIGLHGRPIRIAKFRTMVQEADLLRDELRHLAEDTLAFKIKDDPRITRVGKFLRQYHIDELPQIWNVLLGEMSLVGPRPLPPDEAAGEEWWHRRRLSVLPGMTCYWQVTGNHQMSFTEWAQLDLLYIDNWSIWLDLKLILLSIQAMFRKQGW